MRWRRWWLVCAVGWAAGCATARASHDPAAAGFDQAPGQPLAGVGFQVAPEELTMDLRLRGLSIGRLRVAVGEPGEIAGRRVVIVRSVVDSAGLLSLVKDLTWELETTLDLDSGFPIEESSRYSARVDGADERGADSRSFRAGEMLHNFHSMALAVRGWNPDDGDRVELRVNIFGRFRVRLHMAGRAYDRGFGRPVVRFDGSARIGRDHAFSVLVTDDASRVPLRVEFDSELGRFSAVLIRYRNARWRWPRPREYKGVFPG